MPSHTGNAPLVPVLESVAGFDAWKEALHAHLAAKGLEHFLTPDFLSTDPVPAPPRSHLAERGAWARNRQLVKQIIKLSTAPLAYTNMPTYRPRHKDPLHHYTHVLAYISNAAETERDAPGIIADLCRLDRVRCRSLASYQAALQRLRRKLDLLGYKVDERFYVHVAINGLYKTNPRWAAGLRKEMAEGKLSWDKLMRAMFAKAIVERRPSPEF